jgi:hypothetical protein
MEEVGPHAQGGSSTETIGFMGVFVDTAKTVVVGARVVAEGVKVSDTAYTDNDGAYLFAFDSLALGDTFQLKATYNDSELVADIQGLVAETMFYAYDSLEGADDSLLVKLAGPDDDEGTPAALVRTDTMYAPGFIHGQVLLVDSGAGGVHAYIPGTSYGAWTDDTGGFVVSRIPPGVYDLRISHTGYVDTLLVSVAVRPNAVTAVGMVSLPLDAGYPPPSPDTIYASYDTARGIAHIRWSAVHVSDLAGYQLSADSGSGPYRVGPHVIADTCYADTVFEDLLSARSCTIRYQVRSVDTLNDMSQYSPDRTW